MKLDGIDHLAIRVRDLDRSLSFYQRVLGAEVVTFGAGRKAVRLGRNKINLHDAETDATPVAAHPTPGATDLCFLTQTPLEEVVSHVEACGIEVELGPVDRTGSDGPIRSVYFRDPDGNLIEVSNRLRG